MTSSVDAPAAPSASGRDTDDDSRRAAAEAWVAHFTEGWRAPTSPDAFADHFVPVLHPEIRLIQPQIPTLVGHRAFRERFVRPLFTMIPDLHGDVERWATDGDVLYVELRLQGTVGGRPFAWTVCDRVLLRDGVAVERRSYMDPSALLGAVLTRPSAWPRFARARMRELANRRKERTR